MHILLLRSVMKRSQSIIDIWQKKKHKRKKDKSLQEAKNVR